MLCIHVRAYTHTRTNNTNRLDHEEEGQMENLKRQTVYVSGLTHFLLRQKGLTM